jgi:DNA primase large subunit
MRAIGGTNQAAKSKESPGKSPLKVGILDSFNDQTDTLGLSFYEEAPLGELNLSEFQEHACARLKVLHAVDRHCGYDFNLTGIADKRMGIEKELAEHKLATKMSSVSSPKFEEERLNFLRRDSISHFIMRLAFCKTRDSREWLLRQEQRLFAHRFEGLPQLAKERFVVESGLKIKKFEPTGTLNLLDLQSYSAGSKIWGDYGGKPQYESNFYELAFQDVHPSLIARRAVIIENGRAYVPSSALMLIVAGRFKEKLSAALDVACRGLPRALSDPQVGRFLKLLQDNGMQLLVAKASSGPGEPEEKLSLATFEDIMPRSMPPCMRMMVQYQRESRKHLKHLGRLQLRPFLKDAGFTYEESHKFWRQELMRDPAIDGVSYEKNYAYDIDHAYKKKGGHQGQNPFGCAKIIGFPNITGAQIHGCPFRHLEMRNLKQMLYTWRVPEDNINKIEKLVTHGKHFQLACVEYFEATHPGHRGDAVGNHPNIFFNESCKCHNASKKKEEEAAAAGATASQQPTTAP